MGLVLLKEAAVDGTKLVADVSGRHTYGQARLAEEEARLDALVEALIERLLQEAESVDQQEEKSPGDKGGGPLVSEELLDAKRRRERLRQAREEMQKSGRKAVAATDPESRVTKVEGRKRAAYNAQAVVDGAVGVITACEVVSDETDNHQLAPLMEQAIQNVGDTPEKTVADTGYWSQETLRYAKDHLPDAYIREVQKADSHAGFVYDEPGDRFIGEDGRVLEFWSEREKQGRKYRIYRSPRKGSRPKKELWVRLDDELSLWMRQKLASPEGEQIYKRRRAIVEPVFGHLKVAYGLRRLLLRGLSGAQSEYFLASIAHNLGKIRTYAPAV
jgi:hypothetical protein